MDHPIVKAALGAAILVLIAATTSYLFLGIEFVTAIAVTLSLALALRAVDAESTIKQRQAEAPSKIDEIARLAREDGRNEGRTEAIQMYTLCKETSSKSYKKRPNEEETIKLNYGEFSEND